MNSLKVMEITKLAVDNEMVCLVDFSPTIELSIQMFCCTKRLFWAIYMPYKILKEIN